ncbi:MAG: hypothetical protein PHD13_00250 [Methanocellales archaeon]|nr:hypothetical protein [Methanocellales archaeon]MDD3291514.1 hypothetical protein [Methanocellales archaeon]MDD5234596.1 hypothetical protein [Methanocellales archaeon]MDD5485051.1 hypothetical protein [Methanocellales archaeon]
MEHIHLIVAGNESIEKHVGALEHFKPYRVLLFNVADDVESKKIDELMQIFDSMKIRARKKDVTTKYGEIFLAALSEIAGFRGDSKDINFAVNVSTGRRLAVAAIEDAARSPLGGDEIGEAHGPHEKSMHSIRYEIVEKEGAFTVQVAPLAGTPGLPLNLTYKLMPFKKARLEKIQYCTLGLSIKLQFLKNRWKRRLGLRK